MVKFIANYLIFAMDTVLRMSTLVCLLASSLLVVEKVLFFVCQFSNLKVYENVFQFQQPIGGIYTFSKYGVMTSENRGTSTTSFQIWFPFLSLL